MHIAVFGLGYVGTTSAACLAKFGHTIIGVDVNPDKVTIINQGRSPVHEPGVNELLTAYVTDQKISAVSDPEAALTNCDAALVCVGTPSSANGAVDESHLRHVIEQIATARKTQNKVITIIVRSTALPEAHVRMIDLITEIVPGDQPAAYCVHPEFLRAGQAVEDFIDPPMAVYGCTDAAATTVSKALYPGIQCSQNYTDPATAAMIKYACNCFHAVKVTFANEFGLIGKAMGIDAREIMQIVCQDEKLNISPAYLKPGLAFGGSCLPKDLRGLMAWGRRSFVDAPMLEHVMASNQSQIDQIVGRIMINTPKSVGIFGLAFKENTDDLRESALVSIAEQLLGKGYKIRFYDPALTVQNMVGANKSFALSALPHLADMLVETPDTLIANADCIVVARAFDDVEWTGLPWRPEQSVLDLTGRLPTLPHITSIDGLYWE